MTRGFINKVTELQNWIISVIVTVIFAFRWRTCLPFSGYMPSIAENTDQLDVWARYVIWARDPFSWPISVINGLNFPFYDASIARGPLPFFAIIFKALSKINGIFANFYYFPLVEMIFVFFSAYFTCLMMDSLKSKACLLKLLGATMVGLSFPLLYRSSNYYGVTYFVSYIPFYMGFAYFYLRLFNNTDRKSLFIFIIFIAILTSIFEHYVLFGIYFLLGVCTLCCLVNCIYNNNVKNMLRLKYSAAALTLGFIATLSVVYMLGGNQGDIDYNVIKSASPLLGRFSTDWGYGGGYGGGFHVADVLTLIIPPNYQPLLPAYKWCGPSAVLTELGFPLTTNNLQDGQYEGFSYLGTAAILLACTLAITGIFLFVKKRNKYLSKMSFVHDSSLIMKNELVNYQLMMGLSSVLLFVLSWGYIIHIGGVRINEISTPSLIIAEIWPKFMFVRTMGRLAIPFMLFVTIAIVVMFGRLLNRLTSKTTKAGLVYGLVIMIVIGFHTYEIKGYLEPPQTVVFGNQIASEFGDSDVLIIRKATANKKAIMAVPAIRENEQWLKICYSLAFFAQVPINGFYSGLAVNEEHIKRNRLDTTAIISGKIKNIKERYGNVVIAAPPHVADKIMKLADMPLKGHKLKHKGVVILTLEEF
ncbi:MAG: hypothetical protein NTX75_03445 [Proteobacteria bacterium]|nr:hypothetical protein [Pseudomonadota bacterium]